MGVQFCGVAKLPPANCEKYLVSSKSVF